MKQWAVLDYSAMTSVRAYEALVVDRGTVIQRGRRKFPSGAWALLLDTAHALTDHDAAKTLQRHWDSGRDTIRLGRRFNGRELIYQVRTVSVDAMTETQTNNTQHSHTQEER